MRGWLRQAGVLVFMAAAASQGAAAPPAVCPIIGAVASLAKCELVVLTEITNRLKCCEMMLSEGVDIIEASPNICSAVVVFVLDEISNAIPEATEAYGMKMTWGHNEEGGGRLGDIRKRQEHIIVFWGANVFFDPGYDRIGWGLAKIFDGDMNGPRFVRSVGSLRFAKFNLVDQKIGAQLPAPVAYHHNDSENECESLNNCGSSDAVSGDFGAVISRRFFFVLSFGLGSFLLSVWAGSNLDDNRKILCPALLFVVGLVILLGGLGLLWATQFPETWGWVL